MANPVVKTCGLAGWQDLCLCPKAWQSGVAGFKVWVKSAAKHGGSISLCAQEPNRLAGFELNGNVQKCGKTCGEGGGEGAIGVLGWGG